MVRPAGKEDAPSPKVSSIILDRTLGSGLRVAFVRITPYGLTYPVQNGCDFFQSSMGEIRRGSGVLLGFFEAQARVVKDGIRDVLESGQNFAGPEEVMTDEGEITSCLNHHPGGLWAAIEGLNRAHIKIIGNDEMLIKTESVTQEALDEQARERGRKGLLIDVREMNMADHDSIQLRHKGCIGDQVVPLQSVDVHMYHGKFMVGIGCCPAAGWKVLTAAKDMLATLPSIENSGIVYDLLVMLSPAATPQGIGGFRMMIDVENRGEVEVDAQQAEELTGGPACLCNHPGVTVRAEALGGGERRCEGSGPPDPPALVINGNEGWYLAQVTQIVGKLPALFGIYDVPSEEDEATGLDLTIKRSLFRGKFGSANAEDENLIW